MENINSLYETDYTQWAEQQKALLRSGNLDELDIKNLIEELGDVGKQALHVLESHLVNLILHLLKYDYQIRVINPQRIESQEFRSWYDSIDNARSELEKVLDKNPSLKSQTADAIVEAYQDAKRRAIRQMNKYLPKEQWLNGNSFPKACPWSWHQMMEEDWLP